MRKLFAVGLFAAIASPVAGWWITAPVPITGSDLALLEQGGDATRGKLFFDVGGCASCHATPGQEDRLKLGGGFEIRSPFGSFFAPNISPHPTDGIGSWKVVDLINAMEAGISPQGQHYYPSLPYTTYAHAKPEDVRDLMSYLRTLEPIAGKAMPHTVAFPFNIRRGLGLWKLINLDAAPLVDDGTQSSEWNRGRYLSEAFGHCAECHSARDMTGGIIRRFRYAGGADMEGDGWVPNITQARDGIADWSVNDIAWMLKTGDTPDGDVVSGSMKSVVRNMAELPDADRIAIAIYIKSLVARDSPQKPIKR
jgi:mono/diheme cytochrome c family protein